MNRKARRRALKGSNPGFRPGFRQAPKDTAPLIRKFDDASMYRLKYAINVPGGMLRSDHPTSIAGTIEANTEADLLRGIFVKLLDAYGFTPHDRAVSGVLGDVFGPLPKRLRGGIAFALIEGLGLFIGTDEEMVCDDATCGAVREQSLHPDPESVDGYDPNDEDAAPPMLDTTVHAPECHVHREVDPEHPERPLRPAAYKEEEVVFIHNPRNYPALNNQAIDPETGDVSTALVVPETDGEDGGDAPESTVEADASDEADASVVEEDNDARIVDGGSGGRPGLRLVGEGEGSESGEAGEDTPAE